MSTRQTYELLCNNKNKKAAPDILSKLTNDILCFNELVGCQLNESALNELLGPNKEYGKFVTTNSDVFKVSSLRFSKENNNPSVFFIPRSLTLITHNNVIVQVFTGPWKMNTDATTIDQDCEECILISEKENEIIQRAVVSNSLDVEVSVKENGHFVGVRIFQQNDEMYIMYQSKSVAKVSSVQDLIKNPPSQSNQYIDGIGYELSKEFAKLSVDDLQKCIGLDLYAEYVTGHGMVHVEKPYLVFFNAHNIPLNTINIIMKTNRILTSDEYKTFRMRLDEGVVVKYSNTITTETFSVKLKSWHYILFRMTRELLKNQRKNAQPLDYWVNLIITKSNEKNEKYLKLSPELFEPLRTEVVEFVKKLYHSTFQFEQLDGYPLWIGERYGLAFVRESLKTPEKLNDEFQDFNVLTNVLANGSVRTLNKILQSSNPANPITTIVILVGVPYSGKSTFVRNFTDIYSKHYSIDENSINKYITVSSADDLFTSVSDGEMKYTHDKDKLEEAHSAAREKLFSCNSTLRFLDNTNLNKQNNSTLYSLVANHQIPYFYLYFIPPSRQELIERKTQRAWKNVGDPIVSTMTNTLHASPCVLAHYIRISIKDLPLDDNYVYNTTEKHVTLFFGNTRLNPDIIGSTNITITGYYSGDEGTGFTVKLSENVMAFYNNSSPPHITLSVNNGFKPKDIGVAILNKPNGIKPLKNGEIQISGIVCEF